VKITQDTLRKIIREELETIGEERDLESLWTSEVVRNVTNIMRVFGLHSGRPSTFLERHLEAADNLQAMMEEHNLSEEDLRAMMAYAKTLYSR
jgi:predicted deacetylase